MAGSRLRSGQQSRTAAFSPLVAAAAVSGRGGENAGSGSSSENVVVADGSHSGAHRTAGPPTQPEPAQPSDAQLGAAAGSAGDAAGAAAGGNIGNGSEASGGDDGQQSDAGEWMDTTCDEEVCSLDFGDD